MKFYEVIEGRYIYLYDPWVLTHSLLLKVGSYQKKMEFLLHAIEEATNVAASDSSNNRKAAGIQRVRKGIFLQGRDEHW